MSILERGDCARCGKPVTRYTRTGEPCLEGWRDENGSTECGWDDHQPTRSAMEVVA